MDVHPNYRGTHFGCDPKKNWGPALDEIWVLGPNSVFSSSNNQWCHGYYLIPGLNNKDLVQFGFVGFHDINRNGYVLLLSPHLQLQSQSFVHEIHRI